jgi:cell division protein ZapE
MQTKPGEGALARKQSPQDAYQARLQSGALTPDPAQAAVVARLEALHTALQRWNPDAWLGKGDQPRGLYIHGPVGRGKSLLMDLFFETAPVSRKTRAHFHAFMLNAHAVMRQARASGDHGQDQAILAVAKDAARRARLLCFDEFAVTDIADAMILGRLYEKLLEEGVVVVATSNRHPDDLYKNGLNRQLFLPFIATIKREMDVVELAGPQDYRLGRLMAAPVYYAPLGPAASEAADAAWERLTLGAEPHETTLDVQGRTLVVRRQAAGVARLAFDELCARALGAADYLEVAERFHTVILEDVPKLTPSMREEAARFRILVDALYEAKTKVIITAEAQPEALYPAGDQSFEFERTVSRLMEMRSQDYLAAPRRDAEWRRGVVDG